MCQTPAGTGTAFYLDAIQVLGTGSEDMVRPWVGRGNIDDVMAPMIAAEL